MTLLRLKMKYWEAEMREVRRKNWDGFRSCEWVMLFTRGRQVLTIYGKNILKGHQKSESIQISKLLDNTVILGEAFPKKTLLIKNKTSSRYINKKKVAKRLKKHQKGLQAPQTCIYEKQKKKEKKKKDCEEGKSLQRGNTLTNTQQQGRYQFQKKKKSRSPRERFAAECTT